jgi:hypothetical protein
MATYQLSNTAEQIDNFVSGYIRKDSNNSFNISQNSIVCGGFKNTSIPFYSIVGGGLRNTGASNYAAILGGQDNQCIGNHASIVGGRFNKNESAYGFIGGGDSNQIIFSSSLSTIAGGFYNSITTGSYQSNIGGGNRNAIKFNSFRSAIAGGYENTISSGHESVIAGGERNNIYSRNSFIGGGSFNTVNALESVICGGVSNKIDDSSNIITSRSFIGGGINNIISTGAYNSVIVGGSNNNIANNAFRSFIGGGYSNNIYSGSNYSAILNGGDNKINTNSRYAYIYGGSNNIVEGDYNVINAGLFNNIFASSKSSERMNTIIGGQGNKISDSSNANIFAAQSCTIVSGISVGIWNGVSNNITKSSFSNIIGGGINNLTETESCIILGGQSNLINGLNIPNFVPDFGDGTSGYMLGKNYYSLIINGYENKVHYNHATIINCISGTTSGEYSNIIGGRNVNIPSGHDGAMVLADGQDRERYSKGSQTCLLDFANGVYLRLPSFTGSKNQDGNLGELKVSGEYLYIATGQDTWGRVAISSF